MSGVRPGAAFGSGKQLSASEMSLTKNFSSGSGGGLDRAIDAARAVVEGEENTYDCGDEDVRCAAARVPCVFSSQGISSRWSETPS